VRFVCRSSYSDLWWSNADSMESRYFRSSALFFSYSSMMSCRKQATSSRSRSKASDLSKTSVCSHTYSCIRRMIMLRIKPSQLTWWFQTLQLRSRWGRITSEYHPSISKVSSKYHPSIIRVLHEKWTWETPREGQ
jgi:hypothetical protein